MSEPPGFERGLRGRHIQLISVGGTIGVGLFLGSAKAIQAVGPGLILGYALGGLVIFFIMRALGELLLYRPVAGSFAAYADEFIGPFAGFSTAWSYWLCWVVAAMAEVSAIGIYVHYWYPHIPQWVPALIALGVLYGANILAVRVFGELEFWFALIKVFTIGVLIVGGLTIMVFDIGSLGRQAHVANLWSHGGFLPFGLLGILLTLQMVMFAYTGIEIVGVTAGEAADPERVLPPAVRSIVSRILIFYIGALTVIMMLVPWNELDPAVSPFVDVFNRVGVPGAADVLNFVVITAAASSCNSGLFSTGRMLHTLAHRGRAPAVLGELSRRRVPAYAITASTAVILLGIALNYVVPEEVFVWFTSIALVGTLWTWIMIMLAHMRYREAVRYGRCRAVAFRMPGGAWVNWLVLTFLAAIAGLLGISPSTRVALYVAPLWFGALGIGYLRLAKRAALLAIFGLCALTACVEPISAQETNDARVIHEIETGLRPALQISGEKPVRWTLAERMRHWQVPGLSIAVIRNGRLAWAKGYGVKRAGGQDRIDTQTVFSVGSLSKVGTAAATLRLVDAGVLDLDRDVGAYLKRWQVPRSAFTLLRPVTLRGILSHTTGMNLPNFPDFQPGESLPSNLDTLLGRPPSKTEPVAVSFVPGTRWSYSGGAVQVEQLLLEDVTGMAFVDVARQYVLDPLGMTRSTYVNPLPESHGNIALAHDGQGKLRALPRGYESFPEMAASGLWSTPSDYARLVIALIEAYRGTQGPFLSARLARQVMSEVGPSPIGLGPFLEGTGMTRRFYHHGANDSYRAYMEGNLATGNGVVIFTNGENGKGLYMEVHRAIEAAEGWPETDAVVLPRVTIAPEELAALAGVYAVRPLVSPVNTRANLATEPVLFKLWMEKGALRIGENGTDNAEDLVPADATHFVYEEYPGHSVELVHGYDGSVEGLILRRGMYNYEATRVR